MPPVRLTGDLGTGGGTLFNVAARNEANDGTMVVSFDFKLHATVWSQDRIWNGVHIDTVEALIVASRIDQQAEGITLPSNAMVVAAASAHVPADGRCEPFAGRGSLVLPATYFDVEAHRTWSLVLRARGCKNAQGEIFMTRVASAEFIWATVAMHSVIDPNIVRAILDARADSTRFK